jgi:Leucine-rich repeat (LRR) protein
MAQNKGVDDFLKSNLTPEGTYYSIEKAKIHPEKVRHLILIGIKIFPVEILEFKNLIELDLTNNSIEQIPSWVQKLTNLQILILRGNKLNEVSEFVFYLPSLKELDLWGNSISTFSIDHPITETRLEYLNLSMNKFTDLPKAVIKLTHLKKILLDNNQLTKIPSEIFEMKDLEYAYLYHNNISDFEAPQSIKNHLKTIDLTNNPINESKIKKLKELLPDCEIH